MVFIISFSRAHPITGNKVHEFRYQIKSSEKED